MERSAATNELDLGSDHRAVSACLRIGERQPRKRRSKSLRWQGSGSFEASLEKALCDSMPCSVEHVQDTLIEVAFASGSVAPDKPSHGKPWDSDELRRLRALSVEPQLNDAVCLKKFTRAHVPA